MIELLLENPILLLFTVSAIGYYLGEVKIGKFNLGIAAVLFTGLFFGSLHPDLKLPEFVYTLGLVLFVYTVGLSNGPGFYNSLKLHGIKDNFFSLSMIIAGLTLTAIVSKIFSLKATLGSGLFVGSFTNTPALASLIVLLFLVLPQFTLREMMH